MYRFYYDYVKARYGKKCKLFFTYTDSLCLEIEIPDLYCDMGGAMDLCDTSNFETEHSFYSTRNYRVLGKMKSETGSVPPLAFVGLGTKMYSLSCKKSLRKRSKG